MHPAVAPVQWESWHPKEKRSLSLDMEKSEVPNIVPRICIVFRIDVKLE